jgi:hypothetical protein
VAAKAAKELRLGLWQGTWVRDAAKVDPPLAKRVISIKDTELELKRIESDGHITLLARGHLAPQSVPAS